MIRIHYTCFEIHQDRRLRMQLVTFDRWLKFLLARVYTISASLYVNYFRVQGMQNMPAARMAVPPFNNVAMVNQPQQPIVPPQPQQPTTLDPFGAL